MNRNLLLCLSLLLSACSCVHGRSSTGFSDRAEGGTALYQYENTVDFGEVDEEHMGEALGQLKALADGGTKAATLRIGSPGGEIFTGLAWVRSVSDLKKLTGLRITCVVDGSAMSMAAVILESPVCDTRLAVPTALFLFHNGRGGAKGTVEGLEEAARLLEAMNTSLAALVADRMQMTPAQYREKVAHGDWIMPTPEALANHVIDGVISGAEVAPPAPLPPKPPGVSELLKLLQH